MAKFYGGVGYAITVEGKPGVWNEEITEYNYSGEVVRNNSRWQQGTTLNDNLAINNMISIVADPFANENFQHMRYIKWMGASWKITNVEVQRPRLILSIGGVYNGPEGGPSDNS